MTLEAPAAQNRVEQVLEQAVNEAIQSNLALLAERENLSIAEAESITARLRPNPVLSGSAESLDLLGTGFNPANNAVFAEIENLAPRTTRPVKANLAAGPYAFRCAFTDGTAISSKTYTVTGKSSGGTTGYAPVTDLDIAPPSPASHRLAPGVPAPPRDDHRQALPDPGWVPSPNSPGRPSTPR